MLNIKVINKFGRILFYGITGEDFDNNQWARIDSLCKDKIFLPKHDSYLGNSLKNVDCLLVNQGMIVDKKIIDNFPLLKYIGILATGYNRIDVKHAASKYIAVSNVSGYSTEAVAEFVIGIILENIREIDRAKKQAIEGNYSETTFNGIQIKDKTIGIIGFGRIGQRVAEITSKGFEAKVWYWSRKRKKSLEINGISYKPVSQILKKADVISTHLALTKNTINFFNNNRIVSIKHGSIVINTAPMDLFNLKALLERLEKADITFIFDHADEMRPQDIERLKKHKSCVIYPPIGFKTVEASELKQEIFVSNLENFLKGEPNNIVV